METSEVLKIASGDLKMKKRKFSSHFPSSKAVWTLLNTCDKQKIRKYTSGEGRPSTTEEALSMHLYT